MNYALSEEIEKYKEEKNRPYAPDYIVCRTEQTTNVCVYEWVFSNAKARKCWIIDVCFCSIPNILRKRGQKLLWTTIIEILWIFFLQCDARPNQISNCLFLIPMNLCNKCHVLPFIACPSHFFFAFIFNGIFGEKHTLTNWLMPKKWEYFYERANSWTEWNTPNVHFNMKLTSHERPSLDSMSKPMIYLQ